MSYNKHQQLLMENIMNATKATVIHTTSACYPSSNGRIYFYESKGLVDLGGTDGSYNSNELEVLLPDGRMFSLEQYMNSWGKKFLTSTGIVDGNHQPIDLLVGLIPNERRWRYCE